jgi:hypothetical protein
MSLSELLRKKCERKPITEKHLIKESEEWIKQHYPDFLKNPSSALEE